MTQNSSDRNWPELRPENRWSANAEQICVLGFNRLPLSGTKKPRADLINLTRPLRPRLSSQSLYPDCARLSKSFFMILFWPGAPAISARHLEIPISISAVVVEPLCRCFHLTKNVKKTLSYLMIRARVFLRFYVFVQVAESQAFPAGFCHRTESRSTEVTSTRDRLSGRL